MLASRNLPTAPNLYLKMKGNTKEKITMLTDILTENGEGGGTKTTNQPTNQKHKQTNNGQKEVKFSE